MGQKNIAPTIGVEFASKLKKLSDGKIIKCQIWDTGTLVFIFSRAITVSGNNYGVRNLPKSDITEEHWGHW